MKNNQNKAVLYARVSSREQEETGYSLESQIKLLEEYADKNNLNVIKKFRVSESASGKQIRKTFLEMLAYSRKKKVDLILCEKIDRLTRNPKDASIIDEWVHQNKNREVHFIKENFILNQNTRAHENLVWDMKVAISRFYTNNLSEEVKKGQKEKISQGWLPKGAPVGYKTIGEKGHKTHALDAEKAPFVKKMFDLYATGNYSVGTVTKKMSEMGLRNKNGNKIVKSRIHKLLSDPFYVGKMRWNGEIYQGSHKPLVSKECFEKVQFLLKRKTKSPQYRKHLPVFKAKMECSECGGLITWEKQKGRWYGHCNGYRQCGHKTWIRQDRAEEQIFPRFDKVAPKNKKVLEWVEEALREIHVDESETHQKKRSSILASIEKADRRMERAYTDKLDGVVDADLSKRIMEEAKEEKESLLDALDALESDKTAYYEAGYAIHELASQAREIYENPKTTNEDKRLLLSYVFSNMTLKDGEITPNYTLAFEFLAEWVPELNKTFELKKTQLKQGFSKTFDPQTNSLLRR